MRKLKLVASLVFGFVLGIGSVQAKSNFTIDDIINTIKEGDTYKLLNTNGAIQTEKTSYGFSVATDNEGTEFITDFVINDGILTYSIVEDMEIAALVRKALIDNAWLGEVASAIGVLNGYSRDYLAKIDETVLTLEKNGIEFKTKTYQGEGYRYTFISEMKIDMYNLRFDNENTESPDSNPEGPSSEGKIPSLVLSNVSSNSITINISNTDEGATCRIYRAEGDGAYALLTSVLCSEKYIDNTVQDNVLYSYRVDTGNDMMSEPKSVTTPKKSSSSGSTGNSGNGSTGTVHNPNTGIVSHSLLIIIVSIVGVMSLNVLRKKDLFKKL